MPSLRASALTSFAVEPDGNTVAMGVLDEFGRPATFFLPVECLQALVMTLPEMLQQALRRKFGDARFRLVFPVDRWNLEKAGGSDLLILTFLTPDHFRVSFSVSREELAAIAETAIAGVESIDEPKIFCPLPN